MREIKFRAWSIEKKYMVWCAVEFRPDRVKCTLLDGTWEYMQFTGLKDKNGKEVFEGDVVKTATGEIAQVSWDDFFVGFTLKTISKWNPKSVWNDQVEIIGNVYENPELIEK